MEIFQDLNIAVPVIQKHFSKYPQASISFVFRKLRRRQSLSFFGDYSLISVIVTTMRMMGIPVKRRMLRKTFNQSKELRGKISLLDKLLSNEIPHKDLSGMPYNTRHSGKTTIASPKGGNTHEI